MSDDLFIINQGLEMRTSSAGKTRFTIRVVTEPIAIMTDPAFLAMKPAQRMAEFLRQKVMAVTEKAPPNTIRARQTALKAFVLGKEWAVKRYSGGRIGSMPPMRSENALNDSGRLAKSITATQSKKDGTWRVNIAANRLDESTSGGFERVWNRFVQLVPEFGATIAENIVKEGVQWSMQNMIKKQSATSTRLGLEIAKQAFRVFENLAALAA